MKYLFLVVLLTTTGCDTGPPDHPMTRDEWNAAKKLCTDLDLYPQERLDIAMRVTKIECRTSQGGIVKVPGQESP